MNYFRLIKPNWGKKQLPKHRGNNTEWVDNPDFIREIPGPNTFEGPLDLEFVNKKNLEGYNVYYFPNHPSKPLEGKKYLQGQDIDVYQWVFVDMDLKDKVYASKEEFLAVIEQFPLQPSKVVTSGNGVHVYWQISDLDRDSYMALQFMLIQHFKTDDSVWTPLQLMRWPGSLNTKDPENFKKVEIVPNLSSGLVYSIADIFPLLPEVTKEHIHKMQLHVAKLEGVYVVDLDKPDAMVDELPTKFEDLMKQDDYIAGLFNDPKGSYGDRSKADMALVNHLFTQGFSREEALQVIFNSEKSRSKSGHDRARYAAETVAKVYGDRSVHAALSVKELRESGQVMDLGEAVNGPEFMDCLEFHWRKKQILGLIAPPGGGKTSVTLKIFKEFIDRNPHNDDIFLFFSLEMPAGQILDRWSKLTSSNPQAEERLHIATNWTPDGKRRHVNLQDIILIAEDTMKRTGKKIGAIVIDHLAMVNPTIDTRRKPNFGFSEASSMSRYKTSVNLDVKQLCLSLAEVAQTLDCFVIIQSQTTKEKAGAGDKPLEMNAAYGAAAFEWICDYVITCWQPLLSVYDQTPLRVLAWQYAKIREVRQGDKVQRGQRCLVVYEMATGDMRSLTQEEYAEAQLWLGKVKELREQAAKKGGHMDLSYSNSPEFRRMELILGAKRA